jgi:Tfp pilus assembly protein PilX
MRTLLDRIHLLRERVDDERGWVLVVAIALMTIMIGVGLALLSGIDTQSRESGRERIRESSFNLAEGLAQAESVVLQNNWPTDVPCTGNAVGCGYQPNCTQANATANANQCPSPTALVGTSSAFSNVDQRTGATWKIEVRDDIGASIGTLPTYVKGTGGDGVDRPICGPSSNQLCTWDANNNKQVWVRVDATTKDGKRRSVVALLKLENFNVAFASNAVTGGAVNFKNGGNKTIVDASPSQIVVRCVPQKYTHLAANFNAGSLTASVTAGTGSQFSNNNVVAIDEGTSNSQYELLEVASSTSNTVTFKSQAKVSHLNGAVFSLAPNPTANSCETWTSPNPPTINGASKAQLNLPYAYHGDPNYPPAMTPGQLRLVERGAATYTNTCPTNWSGRIVIKVAPTTGCTIGPGTYNAPPRPFGIIIVEDQSPAGGCGGKSNGPALSLGGGATYYGLIYMANQQCADFNDPAVLNINGNAQVKGAVAVDGHGGVSIGQASGSSNCTITGANLDCPTIVFDPNAVAQVSAAGAAGLVQNTWRELAPGQ